MAMLLSMVSIGRWCTPMRACSMEIAVVVTMQVNQRSGSMAFPGFPSWMSDLYETHPNEVAGQVGRHAVLNAWGLEWGLNGYT
ncbi:hypothetical protein KY289_023523 [Solanum tuberosum]|nr:hypothetical protein KY289_023523 [Solanum tuberosum]